MEDRNIGNIDQPSLFCILSKGLFIGMFNFRKVFALWLVLAATMSYTSVSIAVPKVKSWSTDNGVRVYYVHAPELPMVDVQILFDAGSARDQKKKGLSLLTNRMLSMGAGKLDATGIAENFESVGAKLGRGALRDSAWLSLRTLSKEKYLSKAVNTLATVLNKPRFLKRDLAREKKRIVATIRQRGASPASIAKRAFYKELFRDHPYANMPIGTIKGVKSLNKKDLQNFYQQYYVGNNAVIAIVGAIDEARARKMVHTLTSALKPGKKAAVLPKVKPLTKSKLVHVPHPSSQSHIFIGQPGTYRGDPEYYLLYVANHPFGGGGGLTSRLAQEVREKRGLAYSVYSYFSPMRRRGIFVMGMQTKNSNTVKAINLLKAQLNKYHRKGMSRKEFKHTVSNITGGFALRIDTNKEIVQYLGLIGFYNLPINYMSEFTKNIQKLGRKQINATFKKRIRPQTMVTIVVGGRKAPVLSAP